MIQSSCSQKDDADHGSPGPVRTRTPLLRAPPRGSRENSLVLLKRCFSDEEWLWLLQEPAFQVALDDVRSLDQTEEVIKLALRLIHLARNGTLPSKRPPPRLPHGH